MKKTTALTLAVLIILIGLWDYRAGLAQPAGPAPLKLAVVHVAKVLSECRENLDREKITREKERKIKAQLAQMESETNAIRQELENVLKPASPEYLTQMQNWFDKKALMEAFEQGQKQVFASETQAWMENLYKKFLEEVEKIAHAEQFTLVLAKDDMPLQDLKLTDLSAFIRSRKVLYHSTTIDLTAKVMENLDLAYNKEKTDLEKSQLPIP